MHSILNVNLVKVITHLGGKKMKKSLSLLLILVLAFSLISCNNSENVNNTINNEVTNEATNEVAKEEVVVDLSTVYPLEITDSKGRVVTIENEPETIVSLAPSITETLYAIGAKDKLVARTDYCNYPEEALDLVSVGSLSDPNIEAIIALEPDLIIASTHFTEEVLAKLEEAELNVVVLAAQESFDGVYEIILSAGEIVNLKENSLTIVEDMKNEVNEVITLLEGVEKKSVYYVVGYGEYGDYTATGDTFIHEMLEMAGGNNIASDGTSWSYNLESIIEKDPEVIICSESWDTKAGIEATEGYKDLTAVKLGNLLEVNQDLLSRQGPRLAEGLRAIAELLHGDVFK